MRFSVVNDLRFRCLVMDNHRDQIDAIAHELGAGVDYFRAPFGVLAVIEEGEYLGCVWVLGKDFWQLRNEVLGVLNAD